MLWRVIGVAGNGRRWEDIEKIFPPASDTDVAMARPSNTLPPEIASKLADVARELREHIYGQQACPEWGTRVTQIED